MKITKQQLKALIREQVAAVVNETDWRNVSGKDYHKSQGEAGPYADDDEDEDWYEFRHREDQDQWLDVEDEDEELKLKGPKHDPADRGARGDHGNYRKGKLTDFKEDMKDVAGLMSQAGAYEMPPDAMQRLMRVIKELSPALSDEELHDFAQQLIKSGGLDTALGAPEEVGLQEEENNPWAICTSSVGREDKEKYEKCVKSVKKK